MTGAITRALLACGALSLSAALAAAQTRPANAPQNPAQSSTSADETFVLDIDLRRITETNFEASTEVEVGEDQARGVNLRVGVMVGASRIDVLLRNVQGRVRFRGTLEPVLRLLDSRRSTDRPAPPPAP